MAPEGSDLLSSGSGFDAAACRALEKAAEAMGEDQIADACREILREMEEWASESGSSRPRPRRLRRHSEKAKVRG